MPVLAPAEVLFKVTLGELPRGIVVLAAIVKVRLVEPETVLFIVTTLKLTPEASKELSPRYAPSRVTVPELWLKVPPVMDKPLSTVRDPEVEVKVPPVMLKAPLMSIAEFPPAKVPPA